MSSNFSASSSSTSQAASPTTWTTYPPPKSASAWSYAGAKVPAWAVTSANPSTPAQPAPASVPQPPPPDRASLPPPTVHHAPPPVVLPRAKKRKHRTMEEQTIMKDTTSRLAALLASDRRATLHPDVHTPFTDAADVVKRLLPYHIWQHPAEDLEYLQWPANGKGKGRATAEEILQAEIADTRFAIQCERRKRNLEKKLRQISCKEGTRDASDTIMYTLIHDVLETERSDGTNLTIELRTARTALEQLQREQKAQRTANPPSKPLSQAQSAPPSTQPAQSQPAYPYAGYVYRYGIAPSSTGAAGGTAAAAPNAYAQVPTPVSTSVHPTALSHVSSANVRPTTVQPAPVATAAGAPPTAAVGTAAPVPVQIPVSALSTLTQLGIVPVAEASLAPGQPRPQCVMTGVQQNGTMLALEINVGSLQSAQVNGLALLLGSLMTGRNVDQGGGGQGQPTAGTPQASSANEDGDGPARASPSSST